MFLVIVVYFYVVFLGLMNLCCFILLRMRIYEHLTGITCRLEFELHHVLVVFE